MSMMGQARQMGSKMSEISEKLKSQRATGTSGAGMVEVVVDGTGEVLSVKIDDTVMSDKEMLLDLLPAAINQASAKAKQLHMESMKSLTEGVDIPGLHDALSQFSGDQPPT